MTVHQLFPASQERVGQVTPKAPALPMGHQPTQLPNKSGRYARLLQKNAQMIHGQVKVARNEDGVTLRLGPLFTRLDRAGLATLLDRLTAIADDMDMDNL